jgi:hypothetical protein
VRLLQRRRSPASQAGYPAAMRDSRAGLGCIGVPGMIAVLAFLAFARENVLVALVGVIVVYLVIGFAMTIAKKYG